MRFPTVFLLILTLATASPSPVGPLQRRVDKVVRFGTNQQFIMQPSNNPITNLQGIQTYFQGDGNFVVSVPLPSHPLSLITVDPSHHPLTHPSSTSTPRFLYKSLHRPATGAPRPGLAARPGTTAKAVIPAASPGKATGISSSTSTVPLNGRPTRRGGARCSRSRRNTTRWKSPASRATAARRPFGMRLIRAMSLILALRGRVCAMVRVVSRALIVSFLRSRGGVGISRLGVLV